VFVAWQKRFDVVAQGAVQNADDPVRQSMAGLIHDACLCHSSEDDVL
jgi:hypothetical protein